MSDMKWISVEDRLPEGGKKVLIYLTWPTGHRSQLVGQYLPQYFLESTGEDDDYDEYDEENDRFTYRPGWWECVENWGYAFVYIHDLVTHWMPLPDPPEEP